jgi:VWFA-related protein
VAVAFDRLGPAARSFAHESVLRYAESPPSARAFFAAFAIDRGVTTLLPFTADREALRRALGPMAATAATAYSGLRERDLIRNAYAGLAQGIGQAHVAAAELSGVPECRGAEEDVVRRLELMDSRLMETYAGFERDEQGYATAHALLALVESLSKLPGRKAIVVFSEGLVVPPRAAAALRSVVSAAQRGHVAIYAVDAGGLHATSAADETRRTIDVLQARLQDQSTNQKPSMRGPSTNDQATSRLALLEKNEDALSLGAEAGLGRLAEETGGFLIRDTNDVSSGLARIDEELSSYYLLSYTPKNQVYDGRFRTLSVKLRRPHGRLQARQGYLALKTPVAALDYEAPALARLEGAGPLPSRVPVRLAGLQFPVEPGLALIPIVVEVPASGLAVARDDKASSYRQDLTIVALVKDQAGEIVAKMSQRYPLSGAIGRLQAEREADVRFYRETRLPPGQYTVEAVAYDALAAVAGAVRSRLEVPAAPAGRLRASSLIVVRSAEKVEAGSRGSERPLQYHDLLLYPNLGRPVRREPGRDLTLFVTAWPAEERPAVSAQVEVVRDGRKVASTPPAHLVPDAEGRIQLASSLPLDSFRPGAYELRVTLSDGRDAETRTTAFPVTP